MSKHLIVFVHGMGEYTKGWSDHSWKILKESAAGFAEMPKKTDFDTKFQRVEVVYDHIFENYRGRWKEDSSQLISLLQQSGGTPPAILEKVVKVSAALGKDNFFTTHLLDVVMYRYLSLVRHPVRVSVAQQIAKALVDAGAGNNADIKWSIIPHSLGTSVAHDTLHYMFAGGQSEIDVLKAESFAPQCGLFVANVSRLLQDIRDVYQSLTRPSLDKSLGIFQYYLNAKHIYDPFIRPKPFAPSSSWLDSATSVKNPSRFQQIEINEVLDKNVHALEHYLQNPKVHIALFRAMYGMKGVISDLEEDIALQAFAVKAAAVRLDAVKAELLKLAESVGVDVDALLNAAEAYNAIMKF
jgi:hypothetical protein